ncbi:hypothetical protein TraAM80_01935 [Trypanosoma rangeli]|uniref:RanBP2-type domain-containing protein n=1 Tax=Trypanosoma rangeli TaxID=5698 RepID=A0A422NWI0_TRYRA|nr:uncharacterized protein TraAM80_01935 [Trypanosoma rangeli]RNF09801.1 hypothetical protein TraAM80_01935 [Trypanosoma rangeli]|eukprot:RNF09801.1 hypothetical protein TraAM80_01935 [Trypanosoma rangeli]
MRHWPVLVLGRSCLQRWRQVAMRGAATGGGAAHMRSCHPAGPVVSKSNTDAMGQPGVLPPWPVDAIEFNTRLPSGGHDKRRANEKDTALLVCSKASPMGPDTTYSGELPSPQTPTEQQWHEVHRVEKTEVGARALAAGGWVCGSCFHCMPHRSRSVCDFCHAVRHDAAEAVAGWREDPTTWFCSRCREFNFERDFACRSCGLQRDAQLELRVVRHERVLDEIQRVPVGSVIVTRNRVTRWRCLRCSESNALQSSVCRHCSKERFDFTVTCPTCKVSQKLSNKQMYGSEPADHIHVSRPFGLHNCFPRLAPEQRCKACRGSLHGATASSRSDAWLCACGHVGNCATLSCARCRFPRRPPQTAMLEELLRVWDFAGATNWYCESCNHVNKASRHIVALERRGPSPLVDAKTSTKRGGVLKVSRIMHGFSHCECCGIQWHHQSLNDGQHWRCACHKVNHNDDTCCQVCRLPAVDNIRSDVLSSWSRGDWYCSRCQRQNYREKVICSCGEKRPKG